MKQTFEIPAGCKVVTVEQIGNQLITSFEPEKYVPKVGDCVRMQYDSGNTYYFQVSNVNGAQIGNKNVIITPDGVAFDGFGSYFTYSSIEKITPEEFQAEFEKLGYVYDFETHTASKKEWRAKDGEKYYFVTGAFEIDTIKDTRLMVNDLHHKVGNYFKKEEDAKVYRNYMFQHSLNFHKK